MSPPAAFPGTTTDAARPIGPAQRAITAGTTDTLAWLRSWMDGAGILPPEGMAAAVAEAVGDPDPVRGMRRFTQLLECLTPENAPAAFEALLSGGGSGSGERSLLLRSLLCAAWGARDGAGALAALKGEEERSAAMAGWAGRDAATARAWLEQSSDRDRDDARLLQEGFVRGLARSDPAAAVDYIQEMGEGVGRELIRVAAREQLAHGLASTARWAAELPEEALRGSALEVVARQYMQVDPRSGAAWAAESSTAPDMRQAVARVADRIADQDVLAALQWTQSLPPSPGQEEAYQQVFSEWARQDPTASSMELVRMSPGRERDSAIHAFSQILAGESPQDAIVWATAISDPAMRLDTQVNVVRRWNESAPEDARAWMAAHLPTEAQTRALRPE